MGPLGTLLSQILPEPAPVRPYVHPSQYREAENVRHYSDGMHKLYQPNLFTLALASITMGLYIGIPHMLFGLFVSSFFSRTALLVLVLLMATLLLPAKPLRIRAVLHSYIFLAWRRYFKFSYLFERSLDCYQDYIIAQFPHGAFPLGALVGGSFMATAYPEYLCYELAANAAFLVPIWRHVHAWLGTEVCTKNNFHRLLARGVKGPLHNHHHHHHHHHHHRRSSSALDTAQQQHSTPSTEQQQQQLVKVGPQRRETCPAELWHHGTPFASAAAASTAAKYGNAAFNTEDAFSNRNMGISGFASATVLTGAGASGRVCTPDDAPHSYSAPLGVRLSQRFSLPNGLFRMHHTLSDSESSENSESDGEASRVSWDLCACGSGQYCNGACSSMGNSTRSSGSGCAGSSESGGARGICSCCGGLVVSSAADHQQQLQLTSIPSSGSGNDDGDDGHAARPLLAKDHAALRRRPAAAAKAAAPAGAAAQEQPLQQQQQPSPLVQPVNSHVLHHDQSVRSNWRIDPSTGRRKLGVSVGLMVGGIAEMFMIRPDHERIKLKDRKGFVRIALEHGVDILPVYTFGVNQALSFGPPWLQRVSRALRASLGVMYGAWGLPVPRRVPIFMVTGKPLHVGPPMRKDHPDFATRVDELHAQFCAEMERIYYTHRGKYGHGFENRPLVIS